MARANEPSSPLRMSVQKNAKRRPSSVLNPNVIPRTQSSGRLMACMRRCKSRKLSIEPQTKMGMFLVRNEAPQAECTGDTGLHQVLYMGVYRLWRIHGVGINANMIFSPGMVQTTLSGISGSFLSSLK